MTNWYPEECNGWGEDEADYRAEMANRLASSRALTAHARDADVERDRQVALAGDDWAARGLTTDDDTDEGNEG